MRKFIFRLTNVLEYRCREEQRLQQELADLQRHLDREKSYLLFLEDEMARYCNSLREIQEGFINPENNLDIRDLENVNNYIEYIRENICLQEIKIDEITTKVELKREELVSASKERHVLEKLKEKQADEHQLSFLREEQKVLDDMGGNRYWQINNGKGAL